MLDFAKGLVYWLRASRLDPDDYQVLIISKSAEARLRLEHAAEREAEKNALRPAVVSERYADRTIQVNGMKFDLR